VIGIIKYTEDIQIFNSTSEITWLQWREY